MIKGKVINSKHFEFSSFCPTLMFSEISEMVLSKKTGGTVPTDIHRLVSSARSKEITHHISYAISNNKFPDIIELANVSLIMKKCKLFISTR